MISETPLRTWTLRVDPDGESPTPAQARALDGIVVAATVPGSVHGDLLAAGLIPDPLVADHEFDVAWVSRTDWVYECEIGPGDAAERTDLVFDGLDTVARITLDGTEIARTRNMHRSYRFDVGRSLAGGTHRLAVHLCSAYTEAERQRERLGPRPNSYPEPFNFVRKMACSFGWDWGPTVVGAGIWRPARVQSWSGARIRRLRPLADLISNAGADGELRVLLDVERAPSAVGACLDAEVLLDGSRVASARIGPDDDSCEMAAAVPGARPWAPVGHGSARRYRLQVRLTGPDGTELDDATRDIGFRHVELDRRPDAAGTRFTVRINGEPVLVKGVNWIPGDVLPARMTRVRYREALLRARDAGANLVRVWGGGLYESDEFYDIADELGLLVWQDFAFACAAYPEDEPLRGEILAEAAENVARIAGHPSLVLWNGNNENLWLHDAENWPAQPGGDRPWGEQYYLEDLPRIVAALDPSRPYTAGSPWSGSRDVAPNDPDHQTHHSWDVWNRLDYRHYRDHVPRFVAEFGWQAPPAWRTLRDAVTDDPMAPDSPGVRHRQKAAGGMGKLRRGLAAHFPPPADLDAWHYLTQLNQVRAVETGILHWRSHWPRTAGTILWQLDDVWPALSWSAVDSAGRLKPLYHALHHVYAERVLVLRPVEGGLELCACNDSALGWGGTAILRRGGDDGAVVAHAEVPIRATPRSVTTVRVPEALARFDRPESQVLVADLGDERAWWYAREPLATDFSSAAPECAIVPAEGGLEIRLTATTLLRDLLVQPDRIHPDATADRGFVSLLPGESATVTVRCPEPLSASRAAEPYAITWLDAVLASGCQDT